MVDGEDVAEMSYKLEGRLIRKVRVTAAVMRPDGTIALEGAVLASEPLAGPPTPETPAAEEAAF